MMDYRVRATAAEGTLRAAGVVTCETAREAQVAHRALPVAAAALGRLMTGAALLAVDFKEAFRLTVEAEGGGPLGRLVAEIRTGGEMRARVSHPDVDLPLRPDGKLAVGQALGREGFLRVTREDSLGHLYQGQVALVTGEIGEDLMHYYTQSEQIPSAVAVGVLVGTEGLVIGSGGVVVQAMPGCPASVIDQVVEKFSGLHNISRRLHDGETIEGLLRELLPGVIHWYEAEPIGWHCWCSKARSQEILASLPRADIDVLLDDRGAEVQCHFCQQRYQFTEEDLTKLSNP